MFQEETVGAKPYLTVEFGKYYASLLKDDFSNCFSPVRQYGLTSEPSKTL